jgi:nitrite reductase/ring-hydroxylating ferredoxin subunit/alkylhydroperoxidase/carboxymuconolactone decarboxylase family protein YurZ
MSDALGYLIKARPEAMAHYFRFLKETGRRLDPKTRDLISVITKVHAQTEAGLKQYLKRALADGCSADEVLDALLMAFPALGLTKIVWAIDVILAMDLPEFALDTKPRWHDVIDTDAVPMNVATRVACDGRGVFVFRDAEGFRVYDSRCPHQGTDMPQLSAAGAILTCPKHEWTFDATSGRCIKNGSEPLTAYDCKVDGARLLACW